MRSRSKISAGGAANVAGTGYQHKAAAWYAARILAEKDSSPPLQLPASTTLDAIQCESHQPADDINIETPSGLIVAQAKRKISLGKGPDSDFASAFRQFVRQFTHWQAGIKQASGNPRQPLAQTDRIVLITSSESSQSVRKDLVNVLDRLRDPALTDSMLSLCRNYEERQALTVTIAHIAAIWGTMHGAVPSEGEIRHFLSFVYIQTLDVESDGIHEREAKDLLRHSVLQDPDQADAAWAKLRELREDLATNRTGSDRAALQHALLSSGFALQAIRSYRNDVAALQRYYGAFGELIKCTGWRDINKNKAARRRRNFSNCSFELNARDWGT